MNPTEAITIQTNQSLTKMTFAQVKSLGIVLAAARAANCKWCGGHGVCGIMPCHNCQDDRKKAGIL